MVLLHRLLDHKCLFVLLDVSAVVLSSLLGGLCHNIIDPDISHLQFEFVVQSLLDVVLRVTLGHALAYLFLPWS